MRRAFTVTDTLAVLAITGLLLLMLIPLINRIRNYDQESTGEQVAEAVEQLHDTGRFAVERHGRFRGGYGDHVREIFIITDKRTRKAYLAITGCGVSEIFEESRTSIDVDGNFHTTSEAVEE